MPTRCSCRPSWRRFWRRWFDHPVNTPRSAVLVRSGQSRTLLPDEIRVQIIAEYHASTTRQARERIVDLVRSGHHIGPAPYGYRIVRSHPTSTPSGRAGARLRPDPHAAAVVAAIFSWRVDEHLSVPAIAARLSADPAHCPPPTDPATGQPRPWSPGIVYAVLTNPVYTGRTVWGRTRHGRRIPRAQWITSPPGAHRALVDDRTFARLAATLGTANPDRGAA